MTLEELKQKIDNYIGLTSQYEQTRKFSGELVYLSPTGIELFRLTVSDYDDSNTWRFGAQSGSLPNSWKHLCRIHEEKP